MRPSDPQNIIESGSPTPGSDETGVETAAGVGVVGMEPGSAPRMELDAGVVLFGLVLLLLLGIPISLALLRPRSVSRGRRRRVAPAASDATIDVWHEAGRRAVIEPDSPDREGS
ncbi:MAG: hypothetical protein CMJ23_03865 [Phycisphaerae bacterium]|nr:hypothetical protein [Phycisphaerae bacterium]